MGHTLTREIRRKAVHIITGVVLIVLSFLFKDIDAVFWGAVALLVPFGVFYFLVRSFQHTALGQAAHNLVERDTGHHTNGVGGLTFALGVILSYVLFGFNPVIVLFSIVVLSFGDGFASIVGMRWGRHSFKIEGHVKTIEGFAGGVVASTLIGMIFVDFWYALLASILTMLIELVGIRVRGREIPDNIYIPVLAGTILYILVLFS